MPSSVPKKKKIKSEVLFKLFLLVMTVLLTFNTAKFFIKKIKLDKRIAQLEALIQEENINTRCTRKNSAKSARRNTTNTWRANTSAISTPTKP